MRYLLSILTLITVSFWAFPDNGISQFVWFDNENTPIEFSGKVLLNDIDVSNFPVGIHRFSHVAVTNDGKVTPASSALFMKLSDSTENVDCYYVVDNFATGKTNCDVVNNLIQLDLNLNDVKDGLHRLLVFIVDAVSGVILNTTTAFFIKASGNENIECFVSVDNNQPFACDMNMGEGLYSVNLDVSALSNGLHKITILPTRENSSTIMQPVQSYFLKIPVGINGVSRYCYWINDDSANDVTIDVDQGEMPFDIVDLIDIPSYPLRSESYAFVVEAGKKYMYAQNSFNFWAMDKFGRTTSTQTSEFIDMNTKREILPEEFSLLSAGKNRVGVIEKNDVKWFKFEAIKGDSLFFNTDIPCSFELYDKTGQKILNAAGSDVLKGKGIHAQTDGVFYLGMHDVKNRGNVNLNFTHLDKYCVLAYSPVMTAKNNFVRFKFVGNGMTNLSEVKISNDQTTLYGSNIEAENAGSGSCVFDLSSLPDDAGKFDITLVYNDAQNTDSVKINKGLVLEAPNPGEVIVELEHTGLPTMPNEVKVKIKNTGNVPYWGIPFNIGLPLSMNGTTMILKDFGVALSEKYKDKFKIGYLTDNFLGSGQYGWYFPLMIPFIDANETIERTLWFIAKPLTMISVYAWAGKPWSEEFKYYSTEEHAMEIFNTEKKSYITAADVCLLDLSFHPLEENSENMSPRTIDRNIGNSNKGSSHVFNRENLAERAPSARELADHNVNVARANGMTFAGITNGAHLVGLQMLRDMGADPNYDNSLISSMEDAYKQGMPHLGEIVATALGVDDEYSAVQNAIEGRGDTPDPEPQPYTFPMTLPWDPNDIKGYTADSGSEYIGIDIKTLNYSVEFENDPKFANAPANKVEIYGCLNPEIFDLSSFSPGIISFGSRQVDACGINDFKKTIDMRPDVNAIAEVSVSIDEANGDIKCVIEALDPMSLEPTNHYMQGILPVNTNSNGMGTFNYHIDLKAGLENNLNIDNSAEIIFNQNSSIKTPVWHNVTDYIRPVSQIANIQENTINKLNIMFDGSDADSGIWYYDLWCMINDSGEWVNLASNIYENEYMLEVQDGLKYSFASISTDKAGNKELKELKPEYIFENHVISTGIKDNHIEQSSPKEISLYDLLGRKINGKPDSGIYIEKDKKIVVK